MDRIQTKNIKKKQRIVGKSGKERKKEEGKEKGRREKGRKGGKEKKEKRKRSILIRSETM